MEKYNKNGEHHNRKGFLACNFKGDRCQLLGFKNKEGYYEYRT
jgi:hypothetical protein